MHSFRPSCLGLQILIALKSRALQCRDEVLFTSLSSDMQLARKCKTLAALGLNDMMLHMKSLETSFNAS